MLYRFKSKAGADVLMFSAQGRQVLELWGKDPLKPGVLLPKDLPHAMDLLRQAAQAEQAQRQEARARALADGEPWSEQALPIALQTRFVPLLALLQHAAREQADVLWHV